MNIPEGYKLVPVLPTDKMKKAYQDGSLAPISCLSRYGYEAMIEAAPAVELNAYDEAKERELFEACNPKPRGVEWSLKSSRYIGSSDHFAISVYQSGWDGWKACAKSRARSAE